MGLDALQVAVSRREAATAAVAMKTTGELQQLRQLQVKMEEAWAGAPVRQDARRSQD